MQLNGPVDGALPSEVPAHDGESKRCSRSWAQSAVTAASVPPVRTAASQSKLNVAIDGPACACEQCKRAMG
jgi:hypothetical protein